MQQIQEQLQIILNEPYNNAILYLQENRRRELEQEKLETAKQMLRLVGKPLNKTKKRKTFKDL